MLVCLSCTFSASVAVCDALRDLVESPEMKKFDQHNNDKDLYSERWLKPGTEFAALFLKADGGLNLNTWIAPVSGSYVAGQQSSVNYQEYVESERVYSSALAADMNVKILVPHPKFAGMLQFGLIKAFAELEPPKLQFESRENIEVASQKGTIYIHKDGGCSLLIKTVKSSVINISQKVCSNTNDITELAKLLDYKRLERKLFS